MYVCGLLTPKKGLFGFDVRQNEGFGAPDKIDVCCVISSRPSLLSQKGAICIEILRKNFLRCNFSSSPSNHLLGGFHKLSLVLLNVMFKNSTQNSISL